MKVILTWPEVKSLVSIIGRCCGNHYLLQRDHSGQWEFEVRPRICFFPSENKLAETEVRARIGVLIFIEEERHHDVLKLLRHAGSGTHGSLVQGCDDADRNSNCLCH